LTPEQPPRDLLRSWPEIERRIVGRSLTIFLDFDGTLVEFADRPRGVVLSEEGQQHIDGLIQRWPTTLLTGRALDDIMRLAPLERLNYAANHGFEILLQGMPEPYHVAPDVTAAIDAAADELQRMLAPCVGVEVENKRYSVAVHYRRAPMHRSVVEAGVDAVICKQPALRKAAGKMLLEVRPAVEWDKGRALQWVLRQLADGSSLPVVIGDDETDEDAFGAARESGITVRVGESEHTNADYFVASIADVYTVLDRLARLPDDNRTREL
jgi:trehalose 6-phosphate phosphatase